MAKRKQSEKVLLLLTSEVHTKYIFLRTVYVDERLCIWHYSAPEDDGWCDAMIPDYINEIKKAVVAAWNITVPYHIIV